MIQLVRRLQVEPSRLSSPTRPWQANRRRRAVGIFQPGLRPASKPASERLRPLSHGHSRAAAGPDAHQHPTCASVANPWVWLRHCPPRPEPTKAASFVNQSKGGYHSPYDFPMDVVKPRKRQSMQHLPKAVAAPPPLLRRRRSLLPRGAAACMWLPRHRRRPLQPVSPRFQPLGPSSPRRWQARHGTQEGRQLLPRPASVVEAAPCISAESEEPAVALPDEPLCAFGGCSSRNAAHCTSS